MAHEEISPGKQAETPDLQRERQKLELRIRELSGQVEVLSRRLDEEMAACRELEEAIAERDNKFRIVTDFSWDWEYWVAPDGRFLHISPSCERITGFSPLDFYNNQDLFLSIIHPQDRQRLDAHLKEEMHEAAEFHFDFRILSRSGEERWIAHSCRPVFNEQGQPLGRRANNRDITRRKRVQAALQEREKFFRMVLDATSNGVWDRNLQTGEVYYGENWAKMLGYTLDEVRDRKITWEHLLHPDDKPAALAAVLNHIQGITSRYVAEFRMLNKSGEWQWVLARGKVVEWDEKGRPLRFVGTHYDISDRKKVEDELRESSKKIKEFAYSVVHDLKNPAISIHGLVRRLHNKYGPQLDDKGKKYCQQILNSSEEIASLVDKINVFISAQEVPLALQQVSLEETLKIIREEFSLQLELRAIKWLAPEYLPEITADRLSLLRILRNLIDNALKYGGEKLSEIAIGYKDAGDFHVLSVRDDGVGLGNKESDGLFSMFMRKNTALGIEGAGLGLAIVKDIASQHKGQVWVEHNPRQGITFYVSFAKALGDND
ncbi:MAG: PAS domain S-box protein [Desulfurivibrio sp.]|nr:MAG: PAS domain S-box protein [Desulfurivibrio sp.]